LTRIAIVGAGLMGHVHAESCCNLRQAEVTWVADADPAAAAALARELGARATTDNSEAIGAPDVDAVIVTVPTPYHRAVVELAAARGKHVFCEKPIAGTVADAEAMVAASDRAGVRFMVGHVVRFYPEYERIGALLREDAVGQVGVVRASRINAHPGQVRGWYADVAQSGGVILDMMIHDLDTLRWYFGEAERVFARGLTYGPSQPVADYALAVVRFENGVIAHLEASWAHTSFRTAIEVSGSLGTLRHNSEESAALRWEQTGPYPTVRVQGTNGERPHQAELHHFLDRLADGQPFRCDGIEATRTLELALAALQAVRTGQPVHFRHGRPLDLEGAA